MAFWFGDRAMWRCDDLNGQLERAQRRDHRASALHVYLWRRQSKMDKHCKRQSDRAGRQARYSKCNLTLHAKGCPLSRAVPHLPLLCLRIKYPPWYWLDTWTDHQGDELSCGRADGLGGGHQSNGAWEVRCRRRPPPPRNGSLTLFDTRDRKRDEIMMKIKVRPDGRGRKIMGKFWARAGTYSQRRTVASHYFIGAWAWPFLDTFFLFYWTWCSSNLVSSAPFRSESKNRPMASRNELPRPWHLITPI